MKKTLILGLIIGLLITPVFPIYAQSAEPVTQAEIQIALDAAMKQLIVLFTLKLESLQAQLAAQIFRLQSIQLSS